RGRRPLARGDLPHPFGLRAGGDSLGPMTITASALHTGTLVVTRTVRTSFVRDTSRMLVVRLVRACAKDPCEEGSTCIEGGACAPPDVARAPLAPCPGAPRAPALGAALPPPIAASSGSERCVAPTGL